MSNWSSGPPYCWWLLVEEAEWRLYAYKYMNIELYDWRKEDEPSKPTMQETRGWALTVRLTIWIIDGD